MPAPLLIAGAAAAVAAGIDYMGQRSANKANREEAARNRGFQERMRNTEWQAAIKDMEAAGVNPAVAYSRGGASAPSGSVAAKQESETSGAVGTALAVQMQQEQLRLMKAQTANVVQEGVKTGIGNQMLSIDAMFAQSKMSLYFNRDGTPKPQMLQLLESELAGKVATSGRGVSELALSRLREPEMRAMAELFERFGEGGKGMQTAMPLILQLMRGRR